MCNKDMTRSKKKLDLSKGPNKAETHKSHCTIRQEAIHAFMA